MTMVYSRGSKTRFHFLTGAVALVSLVLVFIFSSNIGSYVRGVASNVIAPHVNSDEYSALSKNALIARLQSRDAELKRTRYQALLYSLLVSENASLRDSVGAVAIPTGVTARVITRPPRTNYDTLIIDVGKDGGIRENDVAIYHGVVLGRISALDSKSATVTLFSSSGVSHDVILGEPRAVAVAKGLGGGAFEVSVPQGVKVVLGDSVRFPGTEALVAGIVQSISAQTRDVSQTVRFTIPFSFSELDFIRIIPAQ